MYKTPKEQYLEWQEERDTTFLGIKLPWWYAIVFVLSILAICFAGPIGLAAAGVFWASVSATVSGLLLLSVWEENNRDDIVIGRSEVARTDNIIRGSSLSPEEKEELLKKNHQTHGSYGSVHGLIGNVLKGVQSIFSLGPKLIFALVIGVTILLILKFKGTQHEIHFTTV